MLLHGLKLQLCVKHFSRANMSHEVPHDLTLGEVAH